MTDIIRSLAAFLRPDVTPSEGDTPPHEAGEDGFTTAFTPPAALVSGGPVPVPASAAQPDPLPDPLQDWLQKRAGISAEIAGADAADGSDTGGLRPAEGRADAWGGALVADSADLPSWDAAALAAAAQQAVQQMRPGVAHPATGPQAADPEEGASGTDMSEDGPAQRIPPQQSEQPERSNGALLAQSLAQPLAQPLPASGIVAEAPAAPDWVPGSVPGSGSDRGAVPGAAMGAAMGASLRPDPVEASAARHPLMADPARMQVLAGTAAQAKGDDPAWQAPAIAPAPVAGSGDAAPAVAPDARSLTAAVADAKAQTGAASEAAQTSATTATTITAAMTEAMMAAAAPGRAQGRVPGSPLPQDQQQALDRRHPDALSAALRGAAETGPDLAPAADRQMAASRAPESRAAQARLADAWPPDAPATTMTRTPLSPQAGAGPENPGIIAPEPSGTEIRFNDPFGPADPALSSGRASSVGLGLASPGQPGGAEPVAPLLRQISSALVTTRDGVTEITLAPEELGRLHMVLTGHDRTQLVLWAERPETLELLRRHSDLLTAELQEAGIEAGMPDFRDGPPPDMPGQDRTDRAADPQGATDLPGPVSAAAAALVAEAGRLVPARRIDVRL